MEGAVVPNLDLQGPGVKENRDGGEEAPQVASPGAAEADPTSDYEALRRERIEKNREAMRRLVASSGVGVADPRPKKKPRPARRPQPHQESRPLRRSRRFKDQEPNGVGEEGMGAPRDEDLREEEEEVVLTSTAVTAADYHLSFEGHEGQSEAGSIRQSSEAYATLKRVYAIDVDIGRGMVAVAGEKGQASIYGIQSEGDSGSYALDPLLEYCLLSRTWISGVHFVRSAKHRLLSSANDGQITLSNLGAWNSKLHAPESVCSCAPHSKGIFSMDANATTILTGSKDCCVGISHLLPDSIRTGGLRSLHWGVVKCVRWIAENEFGSTGNDRRIVITDLRAGAAAGEIADAHATAINQLDFSEDGTLMLSASFDSTVRVHDLRKTAKPLYELNAHGSNLGRCKKIYKPVFHCGRGSTQVVVPVVDCGSWITLYDLGLGGEDVGKTSRASMEFEPNFLHSAKHFMVAAGQGDLCLLT